jgi:hypothetical protein
MTAVPPAEVSWARVDEILSRPPVKAVEGQVAAFEVDAPPPAAAVSVEPVSQLALFGGEA